MVVGGGAAGFFCAVNAARMNPSLKVTLLEKSNKLLSKVKVSGGGRCNVTHSCFEITAMVRKYPRGGNFLKKSFHQFFTTDTIHWFDERGVVLKTEGDGRMFPVTDSSQTIIDCLMQEANNHNVQILMNAEVTGLKRDAGQFHLDLRERAAVTCDYLCIACGGYPKSSMFDWITRTGHSVEAPVPSLFTFNIPGHPITRLMGITVPEAHIRIVGSKLAEKGPLLITHWGISGPAILRLSAWGAREMATGIEPGSKGWEFSTSINWLGDLKEHMVREKFQELRADSASQKITARNPFGLASRLWEFLADESGVTEIMRWADLPSRIQNLFIQNLANYRLEVRGKTTFKEEFVTAGGIQLSEIDSNTMESKIIPHLYFAGEVMNIDGITGGFNFQHAWTSGWVAAKAISVSAS